MARLSIPKGITRENVRTALDRLHRGVEHDYGAPRKWEVVHKGRCFAPKAVIGLAHEAAKGKRLHHTLFSSGEKPGQAVGYLRNLKVDGVEIRRLRS